MLISMISCIVIIQGNGELNDDFAEALEDYYQLKAFDNAYNITQKGKIAESIIDKFVDLNIW